MSDPKRPNILLITTDQQRHGLLGCEGDRFVRTPSLDRLAAQGVTFANAYCTNPVCVPSRFSFVTGRMPHVFGGLEDNLKGDVTALPRIADYVEAPPLGRVLRQAGYRTLLGGKLHVGPRYRFTPQDQQEFGFDFLSDDLGDGLADRCVDFLSSVPTEPFFLWASFDNPHDICLFNRNIELGRANPGVSPLPELPDNHGPTRDEIEWIAGFRDGTLGTEEEIELGLNRTFGQAATRWSQAEWRAYRATYRFHMERVDAQIGRVLGALDAAGLAGDTVVVFTSDHGDGDGAHGLTMKRSFYEESVHVPLIIRDPHDGRSGDGAGARGERVERLVSNGVDLVPTLCDYAGTEVPAGAEGRSLRPLVAGAAVDAWRSFVVVETVGGRMLRDERYKYLVHHFRGSQEMLFDLESDPGEMENLAGRGDQRERVAAMRGKLAEWTERNGDECGARYIAALGHRSRR